MIDQQFEQRVEAWLRRDAATFAAPATLERRVLDIPASVRTGRAWWTGRFSFVLAPLAAVAVLVVAVLGVRAFYVFDRPAGLDGGLCNNRQVHGALDALRDAPGYRYESRDELYDFDTTAEFSFDEPQYAWRTGLAAEGAYRSPDRVREVTTFADGMDRGYVEHLQVGDTTWRRTSIDAETWVRMPNPLPFANMVYGYVRGAFPAFEVPVVTSLDWGGTPAPDDIPGSGGCTVATLIPGDGIGDVLALRIDVASGRPVGVYRGPAADGDVRHGAIRYVFEITWSTPEVAEFTPPTDATEAPGEGSELPPPTSAPAQTQAANAWSAMELPLPDGWSSGAATSLVHIGAGGFVAIGAADRLESDQYESTVVVWTSADGTTWDIVSDPPTADHLEALAWDGQTLLAIAISGSGNIPNYDVWSSPDGRDWSLAASLGPGVGPRRPVPTRHGWVAPAIHQSESAEAGGGVQITPAMLRSTDGREWVETIMPGTGSGMLTSVVELESGELVAFGCESPGATNSTQFGEMCLTRPWRSADGVAWSPGPILDIELSRVVRHGDALLGLGRRSEPGRGVPTLLFRSDDGESWTELPFPFAATEEAAESGMGGGPEGILVIDSTIVLEGGASGISPIGRPYPALWRGTADGGWEAIPLGFTEQGGYVDDLVAVDGRLVLVGSVVLGETESQPVVWLEPTD